MNRKTPRKPWQELLMIAMTAMMPWVAVKNLQCEDKCREEHASSLAVSLLEGDDACCDEHRSLWGLVE